MSTKTLSFPSASFIQKLYQENKLFFSLEEAYDILRDTEKATVRRLLSAMTKRGLLLRLKNGLYSIVPFDQDAKEYFPNSHLIAKELVADAQYYIAYYSALELHSLTTQPSFREQIVVNKQIKPSQIEIRDYKFQFIYHNENHFFGIKQKWIDNFNKVACSDLEKTFIDCLYMPNYAGGISEIAKALYKSKETIDFEKLLEYCKLFKAQSVIKRLGYLLEVLHIQNSISGVLQKLRTSSVVLLEPSFEKKGKVTSKWSVQQNIDKNDIISSIYT